MYSLDTQKDIVVGIGEVLWDILPHGKKMGGAPANFAYHVAQFGLPSCVVSAVGNDNLGEEIEEIFTSKGLKHLIPIVPYPTGTVLVEIDDMGIPNYDFKENVAWDNIPFSTQIEELAKRTKAVCFGSLAQRSPVSKETINKFLNNLPSENNPLILFDVNLRQGFYTPEILTESLTRCNILKINDEELITISRLFGFSGTDPQENCRILIEKFNLDMLILTCGISGSYVFTPEEVSFFPTPEVDVADTVGAGDSFTAAFIACLLKGNSIKEAHHTAVLTSAFICTQTGAMPLLPDTITGK